MAAKLKRPPIARLLVIQGLILAAIGLVTALIAGIENGKAALVGSGVATLPGAYFAVRAFRVQGGSRARAVARGLYRAEAGKFGLTVALFTLVFLTVPLSNHALFFSAYVVTLIAHWLASWLVMRQTPN
ncbi:ATP synthase subunit I [Halomonas sp. YLGW01]|uniref:ATP synthase subunit I n=1 Tax=Halomonas sp. YLGW01 TaxID=2773308 RepID=UPI00178463B4|nr:ATP synthase subunit I [Halomonas sp. YLGW01]